MNSRHFPLSCNPFRQSDNFLDTIVPSRSVWFGWIIYFYDMLQNQQFQSIENESSISTSSISCFFCCFRRLISNWNLSKEKIKPMILIKPFWLIWYQPASQSCSSNYQFLNLEGADEFSSQRLVESCCH